MLILIRGLNYKHFMKLFFIKLFFIRLFLIDKRKKTEELKIEESTIIQKLPTSKLFVCFEYKETSTLHIKHAAQTAFKNPLFWAL